MDYEGERSLLGIKFIWLLYFFGEKMHESLKDKMVINIANCGTCTFLGSDGDGPEYNGSWPVCSKIERMGYLKSFPFKKEMKCWVPEFWHSKFAMMIEKGTDEELRNAGKAFAVALDL
jgi:hypothetical protein